MLFFFKSNTNSGSKLSLGITASATFLIDEGHKAIYIASTFIVFTIFVVFWEELNCWETTYTIPTSTDIIIIITHKYIYKKKKKLKTKHPIFHDFKKDPIV